MAVIRRILVAILGVATLALVMLAVAILALAAALVILRMTISTSILSSRQRPLVARRLMRIVWPRSRRK